MTRRKQAGNRQLDRQQAAGKGLWDLGIGTGYDSKEFSFVPPVPPRHMVALAFQTFCI